MSLLSGIPMTPLGLVLFSAEKPVKEEDSQQPLPLIAPTSFFAGPLRHPPPYPVIQAASPAAFRERMSPAQAEQQQETTTNAGDALLIGGAVVAIGAAVVFAWPAVVAAIGGKAAFTLGALAVGTIIAACEPAEEVRQVPGYEINSRRTGVADTSIPPEPHSKQAATDFHWIGKKKNTAIQRQFSVGLNLIYDETTKIDLCNPYNDPQGNPIMAPGAPHRMQDRSLLAGLRTLEVTANCFSGRSTLDPFNRPFRFDAMPTAHQMRLFAPYDELADVVRGGDMQKNTLFCNQDQPLKTNLFAGGATCLTQLTDRSGNIHNAAQDPVELLTISDVDGCITLTRPLFYGTDNEQSGPWRPSADEVNYQHFWCWAAPAVLPGIITEKFSESFDPDLSSYERSFCTTKGGSNETDCRSITPNLEAIDRDWCLPTMQDNTVFRTLPVPPEEAPCFLGRERGISDANPARTYCLIERIPSDPGTGPGTNKPATFTMEKWPPQAGVENPHKLYIQMTWCEDRESWENFRRAKDGE